MVKYVGKKPQLPVSDGDPTVELAAQLLGGPRVLKRHVSGDEEAHELVAFGIPGAAMFEVAANLKRLRFTEVAAALHVSERTVARRKSAPKATLPVEEGARLWGFAEILAQATRVFGDQARAEEWLGKPAFGLSGRTPLALLATPPGARLVSQLLTRIEYGVYT